MHEYERHERKLFEEALETLPDDLMRAKYGGNPPESGTSRGKTAHPSSHHKTIDLHGRTRAEALIILRKELMVAKGSGGRLLVITGRGNRSGGRPVIRDAVVAYLEKAGSVYVRDFGFAAPENGGDGAIDILMR